MSALEIVDVGFGTTVQDLGRSGFAHLGIPHAGAVDPALARLVNRLVGNAPDAAVIETVGDLVVRARRAVTVVTSRDAAPRTLTPGAEIRLPAGGGRQWHYLGVRGGLAVDPVLGSRSVDTLSGLGPAMVAPGALLPVGGEPADPVADLAPIPSVDDVARVAAGPRADWFDAGVLDRLATGRWTVTTSSRVGVRLRGVDLGRVRHDELASEGLVRGAIQVPPDGDPIMMLADHPTTGGYPVVAVVHPDDVATVAQHPAGSTIRFRP